MKKATTYRQTFRRHRVLLSVPIMVAVLIAGGLTVSSPKSYMSTASLWVDSPATMDSSLGNLNPAVAPPSSQEQNVVTELLATEGFDLSVGHKSALASYLASHSGGGIPIISSGGGSVDDQIVAQLSGTNVTTSVPGPQVLQINYTGPTPAVAQSTLQEIVRELEKVSTVYSQQHSQAAIGYYTGQVDTASQALQTARNEADAYRVQHPNAQPGDPNLAAFQTAETSAGSELSQAQSGLNAAKSALKGGSTTSELSEIDTASLPTAPTAGKKKQVEGVLAGLVAGILISFLGTLALTRRESDPWEDELAAAAGPGSDGHPTKPYRFVRPGTQALRTHGHGPTEVSTPDEGLGYTGPSAASAAARAVASD